MTAEEIPDLSCRELVELASDYVDGKLTPAERTRFEMHLCCCTPCRVYLSQIQATVAAAGRLREEDLPPGSREVLLATFRDWKKSTPPDRRGLR
jgi:anti-sigma factor RsiW